jgi:RHS repeat-associated protein
METMSMHRQKNMEQSMKHMLEKGFYYNRHRYYDPKIGSYINQDPIGLRGGVNFYGYPADPLGWIDPWGLDACYALFPDMPIAYNDAGNTSTWLGGHAGVLTYDKKGVTRYYEYGRYSPNSPGIVGAKLPKNEGNIRKVGMPNLTMDDKGNPTSESMDALKEELSKKAGKGTKVELTCSKADENKVLNFIEKTAKDPEREKYNWKPLVSNHCRTFSKNAIKAGK